MAGVGRLLSRLRVGTHQGNELTRNFPGNARPSLYYHHVWLLTTLVYFLKLLYVNSYVLGGRMARNLFYFVHCMCLYICLQLFVRRIVP